MKKALKIGLVSLASLILVIAIVVSIALFSIFSPSKLAKIVNNQADKFLTCEFHIDNVGLTFFKTFPKIGLDLENVVLKNPQNGNVSDTLLYVKDCVAALNIRELIKNKHVEINDFSLNEGLANLYIDESGNGNFNVFRSDPNDTSSFDYTIDLQKVKTKKLDVRFQNEQSKLKADLQQVDLTVKGAFAEQNVDGKLKANAKTLLFVMADSTKINLTGQNLEASYDGSFTNFNLINGEVDVSLQNARLFLDTSLYVNELDASFYSKLHADFDAQQYDLKETVVKVDGHSLLVNGLVQQDTTRHGLYTDLQYETDEWNILDILPIIPEAVIGNALDDITIEGKVQIQGTVKGLYSPSHLPVVTSDIAWKNGSFAMKDLPLDFEKVNGLFDLDLDLNNQSDLTVKSLSATTRKRNKLTASGTVKNLFGKMLCDIVANGNLHIKDFKDFLPEIFTQYEGKADVKVQTQLAYDPETQFSVDNISKAIINGQFKDLKLLYDDTMSVYSPDMQVDLTFPVTEKPYKINEWLNAKVKTSELLIRNIRSHARKEINGTSIQLDAYTNNLLDSTVELKLATTYQLNQLNMWADTISANLSNPQGVFVLKNMNQMRLDYNGNDVKFYVNNSGSSTSSSMGDFINFTTDKINLQAEIDYKVNEEHPLLQWSPVVKLQTTNAKAKIRDVAYAIELPTLNVDFNPQKCVLKKANLKFGQSDINLTGTITGIEPYLQDKGLLKGNLELVANYLNLNELMAFVDGFGAPDTLLEQAEQLAENKEATPFIVPFGVDVNMNTTIKKALYEESEFRNIAGRVYVKDGVLVLEEMGLTNDAARMQLTAMYRTPRMNHLFLGFDFHLLDIKIDKLIAMIPEVDTILPMLKAFSGNAEFHFAAETYLKSNYDIKYSTLRGAAAINGHDLVVLDNETYKTIAKKLMFNKKTQNKIDSLSTEITIFRNEVDVYPFLLSIDKYQAIISGRHNLDMTYDYNISLLKPIRIGLDIIGLEDKLKFKVGKAKYATLFQPEKRKVVEANILELKTLINKTLQENVR
jgi:hypothetical protein